MPRNGISDGNPKSLSTLENHGIPPFYACYLLRSKKNGKFSRRTYVGSSPDPPRRLRQHNGELTQGARKTQFFRPWETELIVYGFTSKLAALQFEWAWQKAEASRYLRRPAPTALRKEPSVSYFPNKAYNTSPLSKVTILQRLLVSMPWARYKLSVELYSTDAEEWWRIAPPRTLRPDTSASKINTKPAASAVSVKHGSAKTKKVSLVNIADDAKEMKLLEAGLKEIGKPDLSHVVTSTRLEGIDGARLYRNVGSTPPCPDGIGPILVEDEIWSEEHLAKWELVQEKKNPQCSVCAQPIDTSDHVSFSLCHGSEQCQSLSHLACLSKRFLSVEAASSTTPPPLLPDHGTCPTCDTAIRWGDVIRGCYRRKVHVEDNGITRSKNRRRVARMAKLKAIVNGEVDGFTAVDDVESEGKKIQPVRRGRPPKAATIGKEGDNAVRMNKKLVKRRAKQPDDTKEAIEPIYDDTKILVQDADLNVTRALTPAHADTGNLDTDSELSERFDFDTDEEKDDLDRDLDASDMEKEAAYFAAAEGSREMRVDDFEELATSSLSSPSSSSSYSFPQTAASANKRRRAPNVEAVNGQTLATFPRTIPRVK